MKRIMGMLAIMALAVNAQATVTISVDADAIKNQTGVLIPQNTGLVLLVADTSNGGFSTVLTSGLSLALDQNWIGDDRIIGKFNVNFADGAMSHTFSSMAFGGGWGAGDNLAIFWFPTLTTGSTVTGSGNFYGFFTTLGVTPADGSAVGMSFLTDDGDNLGPGPEPAASGNASSQIPAVPEPSSIMLIGVGLLGMVGLIRRRS